MLMQISEQLPASTFSIFIDHSIVPSVQTSG